MSIIENIPQGFPKTGALETVDYLYLTQKARGNFNKKIEQVTGIALSNPYQRAAAGLMTHCNMKPNGSLAHRMRSIEETCWMGGFDGGRLIGYQEMGSTSVDHILRAIILKRWWQDLAIIHPFQFPVQQKIIDGHLYCLQKEGRFLPL